jgi:hypothetical protein
MLVYAGALHMSYDLSTMLNFTEVYIFAGHCPEVLTSSCRSCSDIAGSYCATNDELGTLRGETDFTHSIDLVVTS